MMQQYMKELEQEPFDPEEFIERLAWRTMIEAQVEDFEPEVLHESFTQAINDLTLLQTHQRKKCQRLEAQVRDEETKFFAEISKLTLDNKKSIETFQELDGKITHVASKVLHLGDQLDNVNGPRNRVCEAQKLMSHLNEFLTTGPLTSNTFTDVSKVDEAADVIQKLFVISQDLPNDKFNWVLEKIKRKYDDIERALIEDFVSAQKRNDFGRMRQIANAMTQFKGYSRCVNEFIEYGQKGCLLQKDVFGHILELCKHNNEIIKQVFTNPEQVMSKFVLNLYQLKINEHIRSKLTNDLDTHTYLRTLFDLYSKTNQLSKSLCVYKMGSDKNFLNKLTGNIFGKYIEKYIDLELKCLKQRCQNNLQKYYESKNHQKKQIQTGGFQDLKRDLFAKANINLSQAENYGGETFLSEELAIMILQDTKNAFQRCQLLSKPENKAGNASQILDCLINCLLTEHVDYALELGLQAIPNAELGKTPPKIYFFNIVHQCNNITHLLEKQFQDLVVPMLLNSPKYNDCLQKKKFVLEDIERKVNNGIDRSLNSIALWIKLYLQAEQKKTDFKPESDDFDTVSSNACKTVSQYVTNTIKEIKQTLDGNNVNAVLQELGIRLHRIVYDHLLQFQFNTAGAMVAICDLNEYRLCTKPLGSFVQELFETLHSLCNLLLVKPENLTQVCSEDSLVNLDKSVLHNFIQLRSDFKMQKQTMLKV